MAKQPTSQKDRLINGDPVTKLKTDKRSLSFWTDPKFNSQPFITTELPGVEEDNPNLGLLGNGDFLLRAGSVDRTAKDIERFTKYFSTNQGLLFVAKENLLSRTAAKTQGAKGLGQGAYLPTNTIAQLGVSAAGGHLVKQGLNPFLDVNTPRTSDAPETFVGRLLRTVSDFSSFPIYSQQVQKSQSNKENRLVLLRDSKISIPGQAKPNIDTVSGILSQVTSLFGGRAGKIGRQLKKLGKVNDLLGNLSGALKGNNISADKNQILNYSGGPGSYQGVGRTAINRVSDTTAYLNVDNFTSKFPFIDTSGELQTKSDESVELGTGEIIEEVKAPLADPTGKTSRLVTLTAANVTNGSSTDGVIEGLQYSAKRASNTNAYDQAERGESFRKKNFLLNQQQIKAKSDAANDGDHKVLSDFRSDVIGESRKPGASKNVLSNPLDYTDPKVRQETRVNIGDPGTPLKNLSSYSLGTQNPLTRDSLNSLPLYESQGVTANTRKNDFVKFRIAVPDTDNPSKKTYIHFRAFIDGFTDNYSSEWNGVKYMGRVDPLYKFGGYNRSVVMSWTIAAQSREELIVMYTKLNYLQSVMTGDYSKSGYMAGNIINMTVGGYFWETPCVINSMNITIPGESPWEIGVADDTSQQGYNPGQSIPTEKGVKEMPHVIQVTGFSFTPLHDFAPRKQNNTFNDKGELTKFGKERFIALGSDSTKTSYDEINGGVREDLSFDPTDLSPTQTETTQPAAEQRVGTVEVGQGAFGGDFDIGGFQDISQFDSTTTDINTDSQGLPF